MSQQISPTGPAAKAIVDSLYPQEQVLWLGWAREDRRRGRHFIVARTSKRLLGAAPIVAPSGQQRWQLELGGCIQVRVGGDELVTPPQGSRLRLLDVYAPTPPVTARLKRWWTQSSYRTPSAHTQVPSTQRPPAPPTGTAGKSQASRSVNNPPIPSRLIRSAVDAEALAAHHMQRLGFTDARVTAKGADGGIDVLSASAVAQVKHYNRSVGRPAVQGIVGAGFEARFILFYALNGYSSTALTYADRAGVLLFEYDLTGTVRPVNEAARKLSRERTGPAHVREASGSSPATKSPKSESQQLWDSAYGDFRSEAQRIERLAQKSERIAQKLAAERAVVRQVVEQIKRGKVRRQAFYECLAIVNGATERLRDVQDGRPS